jgi:hypothetical protein
VPAFAEQAALAGLVSAGAQAEVAGDVEDGLGEESAR